MPQVPKTTYFSPANAGISQSYDIEFDDGLLDTKFWKSRSEGSQLQASSINKFTEGDVTYGKNPVIENKIAALYLGNTIIGGDDEDASRVSITGHSYVSIDRILLIDIKTDDVLTWDTLFWACVSGFMIAGILGVIIDRLVYQRFRKRNALPQAMMIASLGMAMIMRAILYLRYGAEQFLFVPDVDWRLSSSIRS